MNIIDRLETFKLETQDHPDIAYLKSSNIGGIVNRGLSDLFKVQPKNPITFLANWLLNESRSNQIKNRIDQDKKIRAELKEIYNDKQKENELKEKEIQIELKKVEERKALFFQMIKNSKDIEKNLDSFCEELEKLINASGVYISILDRKRKEVTEEEDENAHLLEQQVIRYVNFSKSHSFLKYKNLENEQGVTYDIFKPKEEGGEAAAENPEVSPENPEDEQVEKPVKDIIPNNIFIEEVVRNPRVKFFQEPRLGCYMAIDLTYKSSMSTISLNSAIEALNEYNNKLADYEQRKNDYMQKLAEEMAQKEQQEVQEAQNVGENPDQVFPEENIILNEFEKIEKKYILSLDTIGQDRIFSDEEKKFIFDAVKTIKESWENLEKNLLLKDRDLKIELNQKEAPYRDSGMTEKLETDEEKYIKEYFLENQIADEREKQIENDLQKAKYILHGFFEDKNLMDLFIILKEFEFVEFEKVYQYVLYFIGYTNIEVNEERTNKLEWKKSRNLWNTKILEKLRQYDPYGSKGPLPSYSMGNKLLTFLESVDKEAIKKYSYALGRIVDIVIILLNVRKQDILRRRDIKNEKIQERNNLIAAKEERERRKEAAVEQAKKEAENPENPEENNFDEQAFLTNFDALDPEIMIPEEIIMDIDDDFEIILG